MSIDLNEQYDKIYRYCYFKIHNEYTAEDLTQETFLRYFAQTSYINRGKQLAYLYTIARNLCADYYRKKEISELVGDMETAAGEMVKQSWQEWQNSPSQIENIITLKQAVSLLPDDLQELILLRYVNELAVGEIGEILGLSRFAVYRREKEALKRLRLILGEEEKDGQTIKT